MTAAAKPRFQDLPDVGVIADGQVVVRVGSSFVGGDYVATNVAFDAAIAAAIAIVNAALANKQDISTAATDAELAAAVATINTALGLKADAADVATDADLAAHAADGTFVHNVSVVADEADPRFPTTAQKSALTGTSGTPGSANKYVTDADARNTNARTPTSHAHPTSDVTGLDTALSGKQPLDSDLTAIAALTTTSTGRSLLAIADGAAGRTVLGAAGDSATTAALALKQATSEKGTANGYASLDSGGKVPSGQIPALSLVSVQTAASQAAQLALTTQEGDVVVRTDEAKTYMRNAGVAGTMADFTFLQTPASAVLSVNGQTGVVSLTYTDVGAASTSDSRLSDNRTPTDGSVTLVKVNTALKPSGTAAAADEALRALGSGGTQAAAGNDARFPTTGQKNALAGTSGTPGTGNEYATKATTDALSTSISAKQDSSTAATDAELASHEADTTAIHGITDTANLVVTSDSRLSDTRVPTDASVTAAKVAAALKPSGTAAAGTEALRALGTSASTAAAGNDSRLSDSRAPSGTAGGVLAGSYPNPTFAVDMATQAELDAVAAGSIVPFASLDKWSVC